MQRAGMLAVLALAGASAAAQDAGDPPRDYPVVPVPFTAVHLDDAFWAPRIETNRTVTIPFALGKSEETGRVENFRRAAKVLRGEPLEDRSPPGYPFDDSDVYKVIEGAAYALAVQRDPELEAELDRLIDTIAAAQEPDGYLYTTRTIDPEHPHEWAGSERWQLVKDDSHELYNLGHLYEAAAAHYQATGKRNLLDVALRTAELLDRSFGPGKRSTWPGHQITEMGLVKLYRATGDARWLSLARFLLDQRGPDGDPGAGRTYNQSHLPVLEQTEAVGHAVRATYMYSGMADVAALTGDARYADAIDRIWDDVVGGKLYVTGGIGASGSGEAFGVDYDLPNMTAYAETCAAIGNDLWNHRLFLLHADARYVDVLERTLYNGLLSGVSLDGRSFFYPNPLESAGQHERSPWFGVACCPSNITRFMASLPGYVYARRGDALYVNLYVAGRADVELEGGRRVHLVQETGYPWEGRVRLRVEPEPAGPFALRLRIPGWAREEPVPEGLYRFLRPSAARPRLVVDGAPVPLDLDALDAGYAELRRDWRPGDVVELELPMPVRRLVADDAVEENRDRVALQRGPLVYALEWPDNGGHVRHLMLPDDAPLTAEARPDLLGGVTVVRGPAVAYTADAAGAVSRAPHELTAIPYYARANRGPGEMAVWIPDRDASARPLPPPSIASTSRVTASGRRNPRMVNDRVEPRASGDVRSTYFHWWPSRGTREWIEYAFAEPAEVSAVEVYWFDDRPEGACRVPHAWRALYRPSAGADWIPVDASAPWGTDLDDYNVVPFAPVTATGLRLEVDLQEDHCAGIQEWRVRGRPTQH